MNINLNDGPFAVIVDPSRFADEWQTMDGGDSEEVAGSGETVSEAFGNAEEITGRKLTEETEGVRVARITRSSFDDMSNGEVGFEEIV